MKKVKVYVVDDNKTQLDRAKKELVGHEVICIEDAWKANRAIMSEEEECYVITDALMPMDKPSFSGYKKCGGIYVFEQVVEDMLRERRGEEQNSVVNGITLISDVEHHRKDCDEAGLSVYKRLIAEVVGCYPVRKVLEEKNIFSYFDVGFDIFTHVMLNGEVRMLDENNKWTGALLKPYKHLLSKMTKERERFVEIKKQLPSATKNEIRVLIHAFTPEVRFFETPEDRVCLIVFTSVNDKFVRQLEIFNTRDYNGTMEGKITEDCHQYRERVGRNRPFEDTPDDIIYNKEKSRWEINFPSSTEVLEDRRYS